MSRPVIDMPWPPRGSLFDRVKVRHDEYLAIHYQGRWELYVVEPSSLEIFAGYANAWESHCIDRIVLESQIRGARELLLARAAYRARRESPPRWSGGSS